MHLLIPTQLHVFGHWQFDPSLSFAFFPIGADNLFACAYVMGGELAAKLINLAALLLAALLLFDIVRGCHGERLARVAVMLLLGIPVTLIVTASLFVENTLCLLTTASVRLLILQRREPDRTALIGLAIVLPALAAVKLHGVVVGIGAAAIALYNLRRIALRRQDWLMFGVTAAVAGTLGASAYLCAWVRTANPVFPLMNDVFRSPFWPPIAFVDSRYIGHLTMDLLYRMTFATDRFLEAQAGALGFAFIALLAAGAVAALLSSLPDVITALLVAGIYSVIVLTQEQYVRYLFPVFPLLLIVCMHALAVMARLHILRPLLAVGVAALALLDITRLPSAGWILRDTDLRALFDPQRRQAMLRDQVPERLANEAINALDADAPRVIYASDPYGALLHGTPIYTNWYNLSFATALRDAATAEQIAAVIAAQQADFAVVNTQSEQSNDRKIARFAEQHGTLVATIGRLRLYRLK
jgi:hypothetical protein